MAFTLDVLGDEQYSLYLQRVGSRSSSGSGNSGGGGGSSIGGRGSGGSSSGNTGGGPRPRLLLRGCGPAVEWSADGRTVLALRLVRPKAKAEQQALPGMRNNAFPILLVLVILGCCFLGLDE